MLQVSQEGRNSYQVEKELQQLNVGANIRRCRHGKYWVADFRTGVNVLPWICGPGCCGREVIAVSFKVVQEWSCWIVRGGINSSNSYSTLTSGSKKGDPKGPWTRRLYPHGGESLLIEERTEIRLSSSKDFEEEVVWWAFTEFDMPGKVIRVEWDSSSSLVIIYDETNGQNNLRAKHTKFFLLQIFWMKTI